MQHKTQHTLQSRPVERAPHALPSPASRATSGSTSRTNADALFAPPAPPKKGHALESPLSKLGSILLLLAISSVAAVGVLMPHEEDPLASAKNVANGASAITQRDHFSRSAVPKISTTTRQASQQAYALAYDLARQRVKTVGGLTREERLEAMRQATAQVMTGDIAHLAPAEVTSLARQAPETVKDAALRGVTKGEAKGISTQSQLVIERMLERENHAE